MAAEKIANFILELVPAPGVGNFTLGTPVTGRLPWSAGVTLGLFVPPATVFYFANDTTKQEWGIGTYTTGVLTRNTVLGNSLGTTAKVNFSSLPVYVYPETPAERSVYRDPATGDLIVVYTVNAPHLVGTTDVTAPHIIGTTDVTAPHLIGTTDVTAPHLIGTADVTAPHLIASTDVTAPNITVSNQVNAPHVVGALDVTTTTLIGNEVRTTLQNGGPLAGLRNKIINPGFAMNTRNYAGTTGPGYTYDRWKNSGAGNITIQAAGAFNTMLLSPATVLRQTIKSSQFDAGSSPHTLSWSGSAQARIDSGTFQGGGSSNAITVNLDGGQHFVEFQTSGGPYTLARPQLETGTVATQTEMRPVALERLLCDRYCSVVDFSGSGFNSGTGSVFPMFSAPTLMRVSPTVTVLATTTNSGCSFFAVIAMNNRDTQLSLTASGNYSYQAKFLLDADF